MDNNTKSTHHVEPRHNRKENEFKTMHGNHSLGLLDRVGDLSRFWLSRLSRSRGVGVKLPFIILLKLDMSSLDCLSKASFKDRLRSWVTESIRAFNLCNLCRNLGPILFHLRLHIRNCNLQGRNAVTLIHHLLIGY